MAIVPMLSNNFELLDGEFIKAYKFCLKTPMHEKCRSFYEHILQKPSSGFYTCPYGLSVYLCRNATHTVIYTCIKEKNTHQRNKAKRFEGAIPIVYNPLLPSEQLLSLMNSINSMENEQREIDEKKRQSKAYPMRLKN